MAGRDVVRISTPKSSRHFCSAQGEQDKHVGYGFTWDQVKTAMRFPWRLLKPRRSCLIVLGVAIVTVMWMVTFDSSHQPQTAGLLIHLYNGHGPASLESKRRTLVVPPVPTNASKYEPPPAPDSARRADSPESLWEELGNRRRKVEETCDRLHHRGTVRGVFVNADRQLAYCFVPKTGCTFWKQVFAFLNNDTGLKTPVTSPFQIPRLHVHLSASANGKPWRSVQKQVEHYHRFMFTRDPYTRLWSAYIDKFLLPDFWKLFGTTILAQRRPLPSKKEIACGMGVNFTEFVKFSLKTWEPHWVPVSSFCDPCQFRPQIVGKMETYTRDARAALGQVDLDWILEGVDHHKHVRNELEMLVEYNFQVIHKKSPMLARECITEEQLGARLWTAFQYNGYISEKLSFTPTSPFSKEAFRNQVLDAFEATASEGSQSLKQQKTRALENAFRQLPPDLLKRLEQKFAVDFEMFGYSPRQFK